MARKDKRKRKTERILLDVNSDRHHKICPQDGGDHRYISLGTRQEWDHHGKCTYNVYLCEKCDREIEI